jgi:hypothetical protein
MENGQ